MSKTLTPAKNSGSDREYVYHQLRKAITQGQLKPGGRIVETACAEQYCVSRTPVREALRMLERDGLVVYTPKKGTMVRPPLTHDEILEVYGIRRALQILSIDGTMAAMTRDVLARMEKCLDACSVALVQKDWTSYMVEYDKFNFLLLNTSSMQIVTDIMMQLENYNPLVSVTGNSVGTMGVMRGRAVPGEERKREALNEHRAIYEALKAGDRDRLEEALMIHLENAQAACLSCFT